MDKYRIERFFEKYYPSTKVVLVNADTPEQLERILSLPDPTGNDPIMLCMRDPEWASNRYGGGECATIGEMGCWLTVSAMALRWYRIDPRATPITVDEAVGPDGYTNCELRWDAMPRIGLEIVKSTADVAQVKAHLDAGDVCFAEVLPGPPKHFVMVTRYENGRFWAYDPLIYEPCWLDERYASVESWRLLSRADTPPPPPSPTDQHIYGVHEDCNNEAANLMQISGIKGWIVWTEGIGCDPNQGGGRDYRPDTQAFGHKTIVRLNYGYGSSGTIPLPEYYGNFAQQARNFVRDSQGIDVVVIGNEQNNPREWPGNDEGEGGQPIEPEQYAACFNPCYHAIKEVKPEVIVIPGAVDGYNGVWGDSREYARRMYEGIDKADGICVHAYTHGPDWKLIGSGVEFMHPPLLGVNYNFKNFIDILEVLPAWAWGLPIYLTETNHLWTVNDPNPPDPGTVFGWANEENDWIPVMYAFVDGWNSAGPNRQIQCAILYRYPPIDAWVIRGKDKVLGEFVEAMQQKYKPYF